MLHPPALYKHFVTACAPFLCRVKQNCQRLTLSYFCPSFNFFCPPNMCVGATVGTFSVYTNLTIFNLVCAGGSTLAIALAVGGMCGYCMCVAAMESCGWNSTLEFHRFAKPFRYIVPVDDGE